MFPTFFTTGAMSRALIDEIAKTLVDTQYKLIFNPEKVDSVLTEPENLQTLKNLA
jgi:hypothetical protein